MTETINTLNAEDALSSASLDDLLNTHFTGKVVRKDLTKLIKEGANVPVYVLEYLLGMHCASNDEATIQNGLVNVKRILTDNYVRPDEAEKVKSKVRESGTYKVIDKVTVRLNEKRDVYEALLSNLGVKNAEVSDTYVRQFEKLLVGGIWCIVTLKYHFEEDQKGSPFTVTELKPIQMPNMDMQALFKARESFTDEQWIDALIRSTGMEPSHFKERVKLHLLARMIPLVENNYNFCELGPRGTGKSHLFQQVSPYAHLISGGKATVAKMFVENTAKGRRGLVCQYDVVCFDEVSGISFDQKDGVNIMKGYMESGEFSRGKESIRADGSIVLVGNFDVDVEHQQRVGHLFGPMPPEMRDDTAFMDRIHAFLPGWDVPKINKELVTNHFGLVSDFLSECWSQLRNQSRVSELQNRVFFGGALSGRDTNAINKTVSGLLKLLYPSADVPVPDEDLEWAVRIAMEVRRRVKEQQKRVGAAEFRNTHFSYIMGADGVEKFVSTPELQSDNSIGGDPLEPGQVWTISPGGGEENSGLYRIEVNEGPGSGVKVLNKPIPPAFRESIGFAEQNLYARSLQLVGDKDPRQHEFTVQLRAFDAARSGAKLGVASLVALCTSLLKRSVRGGLIIVGEINLGGSIEPVHNAVTIAEIAVEKGATSLLMPVACRRQLVDLSDDMATKIDIQFYSDARDALLKAMAE